jgi:hypothetical protein
VDANAGGELDASLAYEIRSELSDRSNDLEPGAHRPPRIILASDRVTEERDEVAANDPRYAPSVAGDNLGDGVVANWQRLRQLLRIELGPVGAAHRHPAIEEGELTALAAW